MQIETEEYKDHTINIHLDDDPPNPRTDCDNLGTMVCFHGRYNLGDENHGYRSDDYNSWEEVEKAIRKDHHGAIVLPIYLYDHSGLTINTTGFSCRWDSGQIGFIYVEREKAKKEMAIPRMTKKQEAKVKKYLRSEIEVYDKYLRGEYYGYTIDSPDEENVDSCWGFDDKDYMIGECKSTIDHLIEKAKSDIEKNQMQLALEG
jgi:hypothetical protein